MTMDIVDAQVHLNLVLNTEQLLAAMDSLGIQGVVVDEYWGRGKDGQVLPGYLQPDGMYRAIAPDADAAALRYPERFAYVLRLYPRDDIAAVVQQLADNPAARAGRLIIRGDDRVEAFAGDEYDACFDAAAKFQLPLCVFAPGNATLVRRHAERSPETVIVLDHAGWPTSPEQIDDILRLSELPNVVVKWGHGPALFGEGAEYPFAPMFGPLRRYLDAFGAERMMWASDFTAISAGHRWADELFAVRESAQLSQQEKELLLAGTARRIFNWPRPEKLSGPPIIEH